MKRKYNITYTFGATFDGVSVSLPIFGPYTVPIFAYDTEKAMKQIYALIHSEFDYAFGEETDDPDDANPIITDINISLVY